MVNMRRLFCILFLLPFFLQAQTINAPGSPPSVTINKPGYPPTITINRPAQINYKSYYVDGVNDYLSVPQTTLNFAYTQPQSYELWFKVNSLVGVEKTLFSMFNASGFGTKIYVGNTNYINFTIRQGTPRILVRAEYSGEKPYIDQVLVTNRWYHLIITYDGVNANGVNFYVDGYLVGKTVQTNTLNANPANTATVYLGSNFGGTSSYLNGEIGLFRAFEKQLSLGEVGTLYNSGQPLFSTSISNKVFEVIPDTVLRDSVNHVSGTISGSTLQSSDVNALVRNGNQNFIGSSLYYFTYGLAGEADTATVLDSPFTDQRTCIYYDSITNKTFIAWQQRPYLGGNRQSMLMAVDHTGRYATPSYPVGYESPGGYDNHGAPSTIVTPDGNILVVHEDQHGTPIYCRRTTGKNITTGEYLSSVSGLHAYPALTKIGTDIFMFTRSGVSAMEDGITKSTDGGATWGTVYQVLNLSGLGFHRAYFRAIYHPTKLVYLILLREEVPGLFSKIYYIESTDGVTFRNITNTFSKNVTSAALTRAEMDANFSVIGAIGGTDIHLKSAFITSEGLVGYTNDSTNNYQFFYWSGSAWITKPLPLPLYTPIGAAGNSGRIDAWAAYSYDLDHHVIWRIEERGGFNVIVQYETFDRWDTWDAGTIVSDADKNHDQIQSTFNINDASKILIAAGQLTGNSTFDNNIFLHEFTP